MKSANEKALTQAEKKLEKSVKRHIHLSAIMAQHSFNQLLLSKHHASQELEKVTKEYERNEKLGNVKVCAEKAIRAADIVQQISQISNGLREVTADIEKHYQRLLELDYKNIPEGTLESYEAKALRNNNLIRKARKLTEGVRRQSMDFLTGRFSQLVNAGDGDNKSQTQLLEELAGLKTNLLKKYKALSKSEEYEYESMFCCAMLEAIQILKNNKYFSSMQWIVGVIQRKIKENHTLLLKEKEIELRACGKQRDSDYVLIDQMAQKVGVSSQTLRNWDKAGLFKSGWKRRNFGKKFRVYLKSSLSDLLKIKEQQKNKERHQKEGFFSLKKIAVILAIHPRTITRKEEEGILPKPRRDKLGNRIYSYEDLKKIKQILQS